MTQFRGLGISLQLGCCSLKPDGRDVIAEVVHTAPLALHHPYARPPWPRGVGQSGAPRRGAAFAQSYATISSLGRAGNRPHVRANNNIPSGRGGVELTASPGRPGAVRRCGPTPASLISHSVRRGASTRSTSGRRGELPGSSARRVGKLRQGAQPRTARGLPGLPRALALCTVWLR